MTLATLALFADGPTAIRGIGSWRVKETERVVAVRDQLRKLGALVEEGPDWIRVTPPNEIIGIHIIYNIYVLSFYVCSNKSCDFFSYRYYCRNFHFSFT
jgi:hypothetical protein